MKGLKRVALLCNSLFAVGAHADKRLLHLRSCLASSSRFISTHSAYACWHNVFCRTHLGLRQLHKVLCIHLAHMVLAVPSALQLLRGGHLAISDYIHRSRSGAGFFIGRGRGYGRTDLRTTDAALL